MIERGAALGAVTLVAAWLLLDFDNMYPPKKEEDDGGTMAGNKKTSEMWQSIGVASLPLVDWWL
jgi:hypothetical protein